MSKFVLQVTVIALLLYVSWKDNEQLDTMSAWFLASLVVLISVLCTNKRYKWIYILYQTLPRDITAGIRFFKLNLTLHRMQKHHMTVPKLFAKLAEKHPDKIAFHYDDQKWTFRQLNEFSNKIGNYFKHQGYTKGDVIALLMENRPEYVGIWLGLSKIGVVTALLNTNLISNPLYHSISVANSKGIIFSNDHSQAINEIFDKIKQLRLWQFDNLNKELQKHSANITNSDLEVTKPGDKIIYIFTSGTTGLPKAAVISNIRFMFTVVGIHCMVNIEDDDVYYNPLPLYHSAGGMVGVGQTVIFGVTVALRKKFSASNYWSDCKKYNCTIANYIGEICRYLLAVHKEGTFVDHPVKKMVGNGLRPQIWEKFASTFKIGQIFEFYGATEGNANLINIDNKTGAVGFVPRYAYAVYPVTLIRCNEESGEPIRDETGRCIRCRPEQEGILIGKINPSKAHAEFAGYADENATRKKILKNVFKNGDVYFNSGDVLVQDECGYYFFKDRTGDTFRWKGENVSSSEIEAIISNVLNLKDSVVYGVKIPGTEGRAGMAAIVDPDKSMDPKELGKELKAHLPSYAVPIFVRILDSVPMTGTFKVRKVDLQKEEFNPSIVKDPLYFFDGKESMYVPLTEDLFQDISTGKIKI